MARPDVGDLFQSVELQGFQITDVFHASLPSHPEGCENLDQSGRIENQRGHSVVHDRGAAEDRQRALRRVEGLHDTLLLAQHPINHNAGATLAYFLLDYRSLWWRLEGAAV